MKAFVNGMAVALVAFVTLPLVDRGTSAQSAQHDFVLTFDGGFAYVFSSKSRTVDVVAIRGVSNMPEQKLLLGIQSQSGYDVQGTRRKPTKVNNWLTWDLSPWEAVIMPGGNPAPASPVATPPASAPAACMGGDPAPTGAAANNLAYIPDIADLSGTQKLSNAFIGGRLKLTAGTLSVDKVGYCWQFEQGATKRAPQPLVKGLEGIRYLLPNAPAFVDIGLRHPGDEAIVERIRLLPVNGEIHARISPWFGSTKDSIKPGEVDKRFFMFYSLAPSPGMKPSNVLMPRLLATAVAKVEAEGDESLSARMAIP